MFKRILIANRGEIACRVIKTAKKMGIETVAVYSEADTNALHVKLADKAVYIGESSSTKSYLNQKAIIDAVKISGAEAVHPGYGFLSENPTFAEKLESLGVAFIGPSSSSIVDMGDKIRAKKIAKKAGVNIVPGYIGEIKNEKEAVKIANKIHYPIMIKAAAGGGGKGMRVVYSDEDMKQAFISTRNEAKNNFSDDRIFIEKFIENPRHIEIQLLADQHENYICLGERECSIQRHNQKVIEEAPSPFVDEKMRKKMYAQTILLAKKVHYFSAGTIEYIVAPEGNFYFLEMNTRLQVEHPVTELITGIDLVEQMIRVAAKEKLSITQKDVKLNGWAMEARVCAEDPSCGFLPSTGRIEHYQEPTANSSVRVDTGMYEGGEVSMFYDSMIAKLCTHAPTRAGTIEQMQHALSKYVIHGISHNISFLQSIIGSKRFQSGNLSTNFIAQEYEGGFTGALLTDEGSAIILCAAIFIFLADAKRANDTNNQIRGGARTLGTRWVVVLDEQNYPIIVRPIDNGYKISFENRRFYITSKWVLGSKIFACTVNGKQYSLPVKTNSNGMNLDFFGSIVNAVVLTPRAAELNKFMVQSSDIEDNNNEIASNIAGMVTDIKVKKGDNVTKGQPVLVIEAMKMENIIYSPTDGTIEKINIQLNNTVANGEILIEFKDMS